MCWQAALPAIIGTGVQVAGQRQTERDADRATAARLREAAAAGRKGGEIVDDQIKKVADSGPEAERAAANEDFLMALREARGSDKANLSEANIGGSDRFATESAAARGAAATQGRRMADTAARIDAPQFQRVREGRQFNDAVTNLSLLERRSAGDDFLHQLRLARIRPNAGLQAAGDALTGYGQARAGRAQPSWNGATGLAKPVGVKPVRGLR